MEYTSKLTAEVVEHMGSDQTVAMAARVSTGKEDDAGRLEGLINYLVREGHCYDDQTEVLTRSRGWQLFKNLTPEDELYARDEAGVANWERPSELIRKPYEGEMVGIRGRNLDLLVTPNHRMFAAHRTKAGFQKASIHPAHEFENRTYKVLRGGGEKRSGAEVPAERARLLGFIIADANVSRSNISFHLKKHRKIEWLRRQTGGVLTGGNNNTYRIPLNWDPELTRLARLTYDSTGDRIIPAEVLEDWDGASVAAMLDGFLEGDGHRAGNGSVTASTVSKALATNLQIAAILAGTTAAVRGPFEYGARNIEAGFSKTYKPVYNVVFASERHLAVRVGWTLAERQRQVTRKAYKGEVYCATVPGGVLMVRRNGKTAWCGNSSTLEHCVITFKIEAPIFVAREAMRHRTFSFNEISGRYAKLEPKFYIPDTTRPLVNKGTGAHPDLVHGDESNRLLKEVYYKSQGVTVHAYEVYEGLIEQGVATEVARNVLPVSIYTRWYQTANLNNWFKFLELRQAENAQWEIRQIANQVADALETLYPVTIAAWKKHRA